VRFGLSEFSARELYVTDGSQDGGIDAFYIDAKHKVIYVIQSKFRASPENFLNSQLEYKDFLQMDVARILSGKKKDEQGVAYNAKITKKLQRSIYSIADRADYTPKVIILGSAKHISRPHMARLVQGYEVEQIPGERMYKDLLFHVINGTYFFDPRLIIEINLANVRGDSNLSYQVRAGGVRANIKLLFVPTLEIGRIMSTYKNSLLEYNPRSFLELEKNDVNKDIEKSILGINTNEFSLYNNGITIISDDTSISSNTGKVDTAQIVITNPQLVNGGQTAFTLGRIYEKVKPNAKWGVFKNKEVLLRVITFVSASGSDSTQGRVKLIAAISKASNSQTAVDESDRRSNDPILKEIQEEFFIDHGLYYERKRGEFHDGLHSGYIDKAQIVDREQLIRICLACAYRANHARSSIKKFFKRDTLEALLAKRDVARYAYGYNVLRNLESRKKIKPKKKGDRYHATEFGHALRFGNHAVIAACVNRGESKKKPVVKCVDAILSQWLGFEGWLQKRATNVAYKMDGGFDFGNYYKGATINQDLQDYSFTV
jgi:hypothetical protein